jgi:Ni2+-binding GTPase involved in maturation of urease and hydrogenase
LVANKNDLFESFEVSTDEIRNFAEELKIEFIETSAKTGENVLEAFKYIGMKIVE